MKEIINQPFLVVDLSRRFLVLRRTESSHRLQGKDFLGLPLCRGPQNVPILGVNRSFDLRPRPNLRVN